MSNPMSNAPVYFALAQIQFNPFALMERFVGDVQDSFRRKGYTLFESQKQTQLQFNVAAGQDPSQSRPEVVEMPIWLFLKADRTSGYILTPSALAFQTTHYETRNEFISELLKGLRILNEVLTLDHVSRIGLRTLNAVIPREGEEVNQYLVPGLHGIDFDANRKFSVNEFVYETFCKPLTNKGTLVERIFMAESSLGFPPDVAPNGLVLDERFKVEKVVKHAVLDTDHFVEGKFPLDFEGIEQQLFSLHTSVKSAFEAATTQHAKAIWN